MQLYSPIQTPCPAETSHVCSPTDRDEYVGTLAWGTSMLSGVFHEELGPLLCM